jgi:acetyl-CoA carboxylase biotin carboxyl carrier protein
MATKKTIEKSAKKPTVTFSKDTSTPTEMKTTEIRDLIDFIAHSGLNEVNVETKELKLHVKREPDQKVLKAAAPVVAPPVAIPTPPPATTVVAPPVAPKVEKPAASTTTVEIKSPMIGTFYRSANPDSPAFVSVGDKVTKGQTVCIIEAMKLFNEIEAEVSGTIIKAMVENSSPVEYDQVLFVVEPD